MCLVKRNILITDINDLTDKISHQLMSWNANFTQLNTNNTRVNLNFTQFDTNAVVCLETNEPTHLFVKGLKNFTILAIHNNFQQNDASENFQPIYLFNEGEIFETNFEASSKLYFVFLHKKKRKLQTFEKLNISDITKYIEKITGDMIKNINHAQEKAFMEPDTNWLDEQNELEQKLITDLKRLLALGKKRIKKNEIKRRISRANVLDIFFQNQDENVYLEKLAATAKVSPRSLQTNFLSAYDISPTHFHKFVRLTAVKDALYNEDPRNTLVSTVAISHGFTHLGQFSCDYRNFFGESPSQTLRMG